MLVSGCLALQNTHKLKILAQKFTLTQLDKLELQASIGMSLHCHPALVCLIGCLLRTTWEHASLRQHSLHSRID